MYLITGSRIHTSSATDTDTASLFLLKKWCYQVLGYADYVVIATDKNLFSKINQTVSMFGDKIYLLLVNPWKGFAHPLNAIVCESTSLGGNKLMLQSPQVYVTSTDISILNSHPTSDTWVFGAKMILNHGGDAGIKPIDGMTSPWNNLVLMKLRLT